MAQPQTYQLDPKKVINLIKQIGRFLPSAWQLKEAAKDPMKLEKVASNLNYVAGLLVGFEDGLQFYAEQKKQEAAEKFTPEPPPKE